MAFHKILCPVDFSPGSRAALALAAELARESNATLVIAHVLEPTRWTVAGAYSLAPEVIDDLVRSEEKLLAEWREQARQLGAKEVVSQALTGAAWDRIVQTTRDDAAIDLVVMGTHGRTGLGHVLLGSVAEKVVRHAACPVLVARAREAGM
jgi:nucleotide-binding universal stress UspA family protein